VGHLFLVVAIAAGVVFGRKVQDTFGAPAPSANWGPLFVGSMVAIVLDLVYRFRRSGAEPGARRFFKPAEGGVFLMIPVWIGGVLGAVLAVVLWSKSRV